MKPPISAPDLPPATQSSVDVDVHLPPGGPLSGMAADVRAGLTKPFKELSPRYFYDERGSELFEQITELAEYYPTRCEREILQRRSAEIVAAAKPRALIELGSGSAAKTRVLLDAMSDRRLPRGLRAGRHLRGNHPRHGRRDRLRVRGGDGARATSATSSSTWSGSRSRARA